MRERDLHLEKCRKIEGQGRAEHELAKTCYGQSPLDFVQELRGKRRASDHCKALAYLSIWNNQR